MTSVTVLLVATPQDLADWIRFFRVSTSTWRPAPGYRRSIVTSSGCWTEGANPFFQHGEATAYLARGPDGQPLGRILAQVYHRHNERHGERTACFGFFECQDNQEAATALIQEAARAVNCWGGDMLRGPFNTTAMQEMGILVDGSQHRQAVDQTYTPAYYPGLLGVPASPPSSRIPPTASTTSARWTSTGCSASRIAS